MNGAVSSFKFQVSSFQYSAEKNEKEDERAIQICDLRPLKNSFLARCSVRPGATFWERDEWQVTGDGGMGDETKVEDGKWRMDRGSATQP